MRFHSKYALAEIQPGESKEFYNLTPEEHNKIKRSAHNYNMRTDMYFITKFIDGALHVTRIR